MLSVRAEAMRSEVSSLSECSDALHRNEELSGTTMKRSISLIINLEDGNINEEKKGKMTFCYLNIKFCLHICCNILFVVRIFCLPDSIMPILEPPVFLYLLLIYSAFFFQRNDFFYI